MDPSDRIWRAFVFRVLSQATYFQGSAKDGRSEVKWSAKSVRGQSLASEIAELTECV